MMRYVESNLDMSYFNLILKSSKHYDVDFSMPTMNLDYSVSLKDHLISMGINQAFIDGEANFSNIRDENDLTISNVLHQSTLSLDEDGVEASSAAAVVIRVKTTAKKRRKEFKANRPFIFIISDQKNNLIHFIGKFVG
jgi:serpin B